MRAHASCLAAQGASSSDGWLTITMTKDHLKASLDAAENTKQRLPKDLQNLLGEFKKSQSVFFVAQKEEESKRETMLGSITMDDGISVDVTINAGSADAAKERAKEVTDKIEEMLMSITSLVSEVEEAKPLVKALEGIKELIEDAQSQLARRPE